MKVEILRKYGPQIVNLNRRRAIRERCLSCSEWSTKEVAQCTYDDCPLHPFRSGRGQQNAKARSKAIRLYCLWCMRDSRLEISNCPSNDCAIFPYRQVRTDRSAEIKFLPKKRHIEAVSEKKAEREYTNIG